VHHEDQGWLKVEDNSRMAGEAAKRVAPDDDFGWLVCSPAAEESARRVHQRGFDASRLVT
jgi:hypothetical protein